MKALHNTKVRVRVDEDNEIEVRVKTPWTEDSPLHAWLDADMAEALVEKLDAAIDKVRAA